MPNNATLVVTGDVTMKQLLPELERALGGWKRGELPKKNLATVPRSAGRKVYLIDKPDAPQSVIIAAHLSEAGGEPEDLAIDSAMRNFGGIAASRLNRNRPDEVTWIIIGDLKKIASGIRELNLGEVVRRYSGEL